MSPSNLYNTARANFRNVLKNRFPQNDKNNNDNEDNNNDKTTKRKKKT